MSNKTKERTKFTFSINKGNSIGMEINTHDKFGTVFYTAQNPIYSKPQAEFIVTACNNFDTAIDLLSEMVKFINNETYGDLVWRLAVKEKAEKLLQSLTK